MLPKVGSSVQLVAGRHGWSLGEAPVPTDTRTVHTALPPATMAPLPVSPAGQQPRLNPPYRAPAALGAPPGEEAFPPCPRDDPGMTLGESGPRPGNPNPRLAAPRGRVPQLRVP